MTEWFFIVPTEEGVEKKEGSGRGHWGHKGRPGKVGGSQPGKGTARARTKKRRPSRVEDAERGDPVLYFDMTERPSRWVKAVIASKGRKNDRPLFDVVINPGESPMRERIDRFSQPKGVIRPKAWGYLDQFKLRDWGKGEDPEAWRKGSKRKR